MAVRVIFVAPVVGAGWWSPRCGRVAGKRTGGQAGSESMNELTEKTALPAPAGP